MYKNLPSGNVKLLNLFKNSSIATKGPSKQVGGGKRFIISANIVGKRKRPPPGTGVRPLNVFRFGLNGYILFTSGHG